MWRSRLSRENGGTSIKKAEPVRKRSSSFDFPDRRGSYLPPARRTPSVERFRSTSPRGSGASFRQSAVGIIDRRRSFLKDTRPLADKGFQRKSIQILIDYLAEKGFPYQIAPRNLLNPQKKDYEMIFQFLYQMIDPTYEVRRIEEEAPNLLKDRGYPSALTKSTFASITRTNWPTLLGTLTWLMDYLKIGEQYNLIDDPNSFDSGQNILMHYVLTSHAAGTDSQKDEELYRSLVLKKSNVPMSNEEINYRIKELEIDLKKCCAERDEHKNAVVALQERKENLESYTEFMTKMENHVKTKESELAQIKDLEVEKSQTLQTLKQSLAEKEKKLKAQGFDGLHAQNFHELRMEDLKKKYEERDLHYKDEEKKVWDLEIENLRAMDKIAATCTSWNVAWEGLRHAASNCLELPEHGCSFPAIVKLCKEPKIRIPQVEMSSKGDEDYSQVLEKVKQHVDGLGHKHDALRTAVCQQSNDIQTKIEVLNNTRNVASAQLEQKKQELELKTTEDNKVIASMESECSLSQDKLNNVQEQNRNLKQSIGSTKKDTAEIKNKTSEKSLIWSKEITVVESCITQQAKLAKQSLTEVAAKKEVVLASLKLINTDFNTLEKD